MAKGKKYESRHVVQRPDGSWANKIAGAGRASSLHNTQADAINSARDDLRKSGGGELVIHGTDGKFRQKDTVPDANDPISSKG